MTTFIYAMLSVLLSGFNISCLGLATKEVHRMQLEDEEVEVRWWNLYLVGPYWFMLEGLKLGFSFLLHGVLCLFSEEYREECILEEEDQLTEVDDDEQN